MSRVHHKINLYRLEALKSNESSVVYTPEIFTGVFIAFPSLKLETSLCVQYLAIILVYKWLMSHIQPSAEIRKLKWKDFIKDQVEFHFIKPNFKRL